MVYLQGYIQVNGLKNRVTECSYNKLYQSRVNCGIIRKYNEYTVDVGMVSWGNWF